MALFKLFACSSMMIFFLTRYFSFFLVIWLSKYFDMEYINVDGNDDENDDDDAWC